MTAPTRHLTVEITPCTAELYFALRQLLEARGCALSERRHDPAALTLWADRALPSVRRVGRPLKPGRGVGR